MPEHLWPSIRHLTEAQIDKITHRNAMRWFRFDPFQHQSRAELTVGALRQRAKAAGVDTSARSSAGERPVAEGDTRPVTSGDIMKMFIRHEDTDRTGRMQQQEA